MLSPEGLGQPDDHDEASSQIETRETISPEPPSSVTSDRGSDRGRKHRQTGLDILKSKAAGAADTVKQQIRSVLPERRRIRSKSRPSRPQSRLSQHGSENDINGENEGGVEGDNAESNLALHDTVSESDRQLAPTTPTTTKRKYLQHRRQIDQIQIPNPVTSLMNQVEDFKSKLKRSRTPPPPRRKVTKGKRNQETGSSRASSVEPEDYVGEPSEKADEEEEDVTMKVAEATRPARSESEPVKPPRVKGRNSITSLEQSTTTERASSPTGYLDRIQQYDLEDNLSHMPSGPVVYTTFIYPSGSEQESSTIVGKLTMEPFAPHDHQQIMSNGNTETGDGESTLQTNEESFSGACLKLAHALHRFGIRSLWRLANYIEAIAQEDDDTTETRPRITISAEKRSNIQILMAILIILLVGLILVSCRSNNTEVVKTWELVWHPPA